MKLVNRKILNDFKDQHRDVSSQLDAWSAEACEADWLTPADVKRRYASASIISDNRVIFNIKSYRLLVKIEYKNKIVLVKKIDTHDKYMKWNLT